MLWGRQDAMGSTGCYGVTETTLEDPTTKIPETANDNSSQEIYPPTPQEPKQITRKRTEQPGSPETEGTTKREKISNSPQSQVYITEKHLRDKLVLEDFKTIPEIKHLNKNEQDKLKGWLLYKIAGRFDIDHELNEIVRDKNVKLIWKSIHNFTYHMERP